MSFDECDRYRHVTVSAQNQALRRKRRQTWTSCLHFRRLNHVKTIKDSETEGGRQAVQQLFLYLCWTVPDRKATFSLKRCKLRESWAQSVKVKGLTQGPRKRAFVRLPKVVFLYSCWIVSVSVKWLAVFLWCPLAGREGRTVLCADVNQALAGLEASQRLAAWEGGQGPTQAHHRRGVVLFWKSGWDRHTEEMSVHVCLLTYYLTRTLW